MATDASEDGSTALGSRADDARYDVFVSHCKRLDASEDRAVWVADVCEGAGLKVFFDRSDLTDISEEVLERSVKESRVLVTVLDPHTFESDWVVKENQWAAEAGRPIVPIYDGDRHRWDTLKKWCGSHPHVFAKQAINYSKDYRAESKQRLIDAVLRALGEERAVARPPIAHAVHEEPAALDATPVVESPALLAEPVAPAAPVTPGGMVTLSIKVPPGCQPGEIIAVGHGGQTIQVACPPGAPAGTILQVRAPAAATATLPPAPPAATATLPPAPPPPPPTQFTKLMNARSYRIMASYHSSYSGEAPLDAYGWCAWTKVAARGLPPNVGWMQKLFPNARIDITDASLANADSDAPSEPPRALVDKFSRIPHGKSAADVTRVGFEYQIGSQWGDQYFLSVEIGSGQVVGGMVIQGTAVANSFAGIEGIYDCAAWKTIVVITATKDPNVVEIRGSRIKIDPNTLVYEMRRSSLPMVWNSVPSPQFDLLSKMWGGAPLRYEFEPGMGAFTSKAAGKPNTHYVKRRIEGTYDGPNGLRCVIKSTADPNVVQAHGSFQRSGPTLLVCEMRRSSSPMVWNGVLPPHLGGLLARWEFEPGMNAFTSTTGGKPPRRYVKRVKTGGARVFDPFAKCVIS